MPNFQAINLEPEENIDEQIDTTKELHVDEALKRFQNALKLHSQGPPSREAASAAYLELFESEIFKYREAKTEYERTQQQVDGPPEVTAPEAFSDGLDITAGGADGIAATLSLALYLSYKNYGQFFLDKLNDASKTDSEWNARAQVYYNRDQGHKVLDNWTAALDQDPSDPELWRKVARFAASINSARIKRYCLEAAIELDDDPTVAEVEPPSLAESLAGEQLKDHLELLGDQMALSHPVMGPWIKKQMPALIRRLLDPIPFLPDPTATLEHSLHVQLNGKLLENGIDEDMPSPSSDSEDSETFPESWADLGLELIKCAQDNAAALKLCQSILNGPLQDVEMEEMEARAKAAEEAPEVEVAKDLESETKEKTDTGNAKEIQPSENNDQTLKTSDARGKERRSSSISTRKRSQSAAGFPDGVEEETVTEKRSKRVRRRTETAQAEEPADPNTLIANQLRPFQDADQHLFQMTKNILESLQIDDKETLQHLDGILELCVLEDRSTKYTRLGAKDLRHVIANFSQETAMVFLNKKEQATLGLSSFLEHAKTGSQDQTVTIPFDEVKGLKVFATRLQEQGNQLSSQEIAMEWVMSMSTSYTKFKWSDSMKTAVVQVLNYIDSFLYTHILQELELQPIDMKRLTALKSIIPMLFELHIDIYERITNPSSAVDYATRMETKYRLERWLDVASAYVQLMDRPPNDTLCVRFMWASVMASSLSDNPVREHILLLWTSLRDFLTEENVEAFSLPNNMVMPTVSSAAADREISKLTTMDFFLSLFQEGMESPVHVIETLEPVLNPSSVCVSDDALNNAMDVDDSASSVTENPQTAVSECANQGMRDLWKFLRSSSTELRLFLWSRLGEAYNAINYTTKQFSCYLKSIEVIIVDLESEKYAKIPDDSRRLLFLRTLKSLDEILVQALSLALNDNTAFDIIDDEHLRSTVSALVKVSSLLHVALLCEDEIKVGLITVKASNSTFQSLIGKLREMQVRIWCLQYTMFKNQLPLQKTIAPEKDLADFLAAVHQVIGLRKCCKSSNKVFLKVMRMELIRNKNTENWEHYLGQVVYDLYGLKLGVGIAEIEDHGCPPEKLEKRQTMQLVEKVMILASRMPMKDLLKSDLKTTIEHMQQTIGQPKSTPQMIHNLRNFTELLKKPIHPLHLYQALIGNVSVDAVAPNTPEAALASHGWFFLLGMIALTKFKAVDLNRRQTPGATDDLRIGATFLRLQLQFTADRWEAWFRLAECFDYELDEAVLWTADKMNKDRPELVKFQRNAIHCYTLALSHSRHQEVETNDGDPLHDLYHKFGMRLYASSREPFAMEPFQHGDQERYFIEGSGAGTFKRIIHDEMVAYKVWKFAAKLFRMAMEREPKNWKNPFMLTKCYWKMYQAPDEDLDAMDKAHRISSKLVLDTLQIAIKIAFNAKKSRHSDPILEPHYKMVSILHKLVNRGDMPAKEAAALLSEQPFGVPINPDDIFASFTEPEDWEEYIIPNLIKLKDKDKSNWQHRIVARHAKILFDEANSGQKGDHKVEAQAAYGILRENMFTKTMVMNVWKCDAERAGRHHVYTEQYVRFMTELLVIMSDRVNLEQLLRRLRKKGADFYRFSDLWQSCCNAYLKLLRQAHSVPHVGDDALKAISAEEFEIVSERITDWAAGDQTHIPAFVCMKEAIELKKLNANLMKAGNMDDLINDCYCTIYQDIASTLPGEDPAKIIQERHAKEVAAKLEADAEMEVEAEGEADNKASNSSNNMLNPAGTQDSLPGTATPLDGEKSEAAPKTRRTGVRRPDVLRKAEQAVVRSVEAPKSVQTRSRAGSMASGKRGSQTPNAGASDAETEPEDDEDGPDAQVRREAEEHEEHLDTDMRDEHEEGADEEEGIEDSKMDEKDEETEVGSIHDSADDESDLSDVPEGYDDDVPPGLLFPNLSRNLQAGEASGDDADSESEGDEEEDEEDEEGGEDEAEEVEEEEQEDENQHEGDEGQEGVDEEEQAEEEDEAMEDAGPATHESEEEL